MSSVEPGPLPPEAVIGIDVVDRRSPRVLGGLPRTRTVERVLTPAEHRHLGESADPAAVFWTIWAAKEAAFKAVTLLRGAPPVFAHSAFRVDLPARCIRYGEIELALTLHATRDRWVGVARPADAPGRSVWSAAQLAALHRGLGGGSLEALRGRFSDREFDAVRGLPSALVRLAARTEASTFLGLDESRLGVVCPPGPAGRRPPYLHIDGVPTTRCALSISHDGDWLAWAVAGAGQGVQGR